MDFSLVFPENNGENFPRLGVKLTGIKHGFFETQNVPRNKVEYS
jgi:hypothetical protein